jgi:hypothetical protein
MVLVAQDIVFDSGCLQLWQTTLRNAPIMVPQLMDLFPHLVAVMERNFEHLSVRHTHKSKLLFFSSRVMVVFFEHMKNENLRRKDFP